MDQMIRVAFVISKRTSRSVLASIAVWGFCVVGGPFENIDFESARVSNAVPIPGGVNFSGSVADLLPGWSVNYGATNITTVSYTTTFGGEVGVTLEIFPDPINKNGYGRYGVIVNSQLIPPNGDESGFEITVSQKAIFLRM